MSMDPESLYRQLGQLVAETPNDLVGPEPISAETHRWLGRAAALIGASATMKDPGTMMEHISFKTSSDGLVGIVREHNAHQVVAILHRALARAELNAPVTARGAFIPVGATFDVFQAISKVVSAAMKDVLIVDAYMDATVLTDFAPFAASEVAIRLLTDSQYTKRETLQPPAPRDAFHGTASFA
jgi:hypothetical protein